MKKKVILAFVLLTGLAWFMAINEAIENPKLMAEHLANAASLEEQGIYVDAITEYQSALTYSPANPDINYKMALAYLQIGENKKFVNLSKEIISAHPEKGEVLDTLMNYYQERDKATAVKYVAGLMEEQPDNACAKKWLMELKGGYKESLLNCVELVDSYGDYFVVTQEDIESGQINYELVDAKGNCIFTEDYESVGVISEDGLALVVKDGKTFYVDADGNTRKVPDMSAYQSVSMMNNERILACKNGLYGLLDDTLAEKTDFIYEEMSVPADKLVVAKQNGKWGLLNRSGSAKTEFVYDDVIRDEHGIATRQKLVFVKEGSTYHIIDSKGETVASEVFDNAKAFPATGYAAVCKNGKWGYVNEDGEIVIDYQFEDANSFQNGYATVCQDGKWGYVDISGTLVIPYTFEKATNITTSGTAIVYEGNWKMIQLNLFR